MNNEAQKVNESPAARAFRANSGLRTLRVGLGLLEAAHVMALEGQTRAGAGEIAERAAKDFGVSVTASVAGQTFSQMGMATAITHGKTRLVLDPDQLKGLKNDVVRKLETLAAELTEALSEFKDLSSRIEGLDGQWKEVVRLRMRELELAKQIDEARRTPSKLPYLENEAAKLQKEAARADELGKQCHELSNRIKTLPSLQQRWASLDKTISQYQDEEQQIAAGEARLGKALEQLKQRSAWVTYLDLQYNINKEKAELDQLSQQLGEKKSLLQRLMGGRR
jgi:myosin heavy subunit